MVEEGKLDLEKTTTDYVDLEVVGKVPNAGIAPLRTLLNHQSGIPSWEFDENWIRRGRGNKMDLKHVWEKVETLDYIIREGAVAEFAPGERYAYSPPKEAVRQGFSYRQAICRIENFYGDKTFVGHSGGTLGFTGMMYWIEETDIVIVCLTNAGTMHTGLAYSPPDEFFSRIMVPAVLRFLDQKH
ncbi:MAG: CubicO group peptidase (beta-lactamase class C family) [Verrucomicrobiales bacterium]|jgi:CubicO group peptidase (beta-lactamase class C family)